MMPGFFCQLAHLVYECQGPNKVLKGKGATPADQRGFRSKRMLRARGHGVMIPTWRSLPPGYLPACSVEEAMAGCGPMRASMGAISGFAMKFFQMSPLR